MKKLTNIKGVIFDMDGLLIDTEKLYIKFWVMAGQKLGYNFETQHALSIRSMAGKFARKKFIEYFNDDCYKQIREKRIELMDEYLSTHPIEKKKGVDELLEYLSKNGYKLAVATATNVEKTKKYLSQINIYHYFDAIVSAHEVLNGKPKPDIYIEASKRLGYDANECLALEDSPNGIRAAYEAGCVPIMIPDADLPDDNTKKIIFSCEKDLLEVKKYL